MAEEGGTIAPITANTAEPTESSPANGETV
jgi:hypothetical protein